MPGSSLDFFSEHFSGWTLFNATSVVIVVVAPGLTPTVLVSLLYSRSCKEMQHGVRPRYLPPEPCPKPLPLWWH